MMVMVCIPIEPSYRPRVTNLGNDSFAYKHIEYSVNRSPGYTRYAGLRLLINLVSGWVMVVTKHDLENDTSLYGQRQPLLAT